MYITTNFKEFLTIKLNEEIKGIEQKLEQSVNQNENKPDWIAHMITEFNEITKSL